MENLLYCLLVVIWSLCHSVTADISNVIPGADFERSQELQYLELILDKLTSLDQRITTLDQRITSLGQRLTSHDQRFTALQIQIADTCRSGPKRTRDDETGAETDEKDRTTPCPQTENGNGTTPRPQSETGNGTTPRPQTETGNGTTPRPQTETGNQTTPRSQAETGKRTTPRPQTETGNRATPRPQNETGNRTTSRPQTENGNQTTPRPQTETGNQTTPRPQTETGNQTTPRPQTETGNGTTRPETENGNGTTPRPPTENGNQTTTLPQEELPFKLRRVTKEDTDDGVEVKVEYAGFTEPTVYLRYGDSRFPEPLENHETISHENRTIEFSLNDDEVDSVVYVLFAAGDRWFVLVLLLEKGHPTQEDVSFPRVVITPGRDVTYSSDGNDAEVDLVVTFDDIKRVPTRQSLHWTAYVNSETKQHTAVRYQENGDYGVASPGPVLEVEQVSAEEGRYSYRLLVNTTYQETDALFEIHGSFYFGCYENCLVKSMHVTTGFSVHHADRQVPFPAGYVAFLEDVSKDNTIQYCNIRPEERGPCEIVCEVVGQDITDLQLDKVEQDPGTTWNNGRRMNVTYGFWRAEVLRLDDVSLSDAGQYLCIARTKGLEVNRTVSLEIAAFAKIDANRSKIRILENGSIEALCVAEGYPPPDVTFDDKYTSLGEVPDSEYSVQVTRSGNTTEAVLAVPDPSWASRIYSLRCKATNTNLEGTDYHNIYH